MHFRSADEAAVLVTGIHLLRGRKCDVAFTALKYTAVQTLLDITIAGRQAVLRRFSPQVLAANLDHDVAYAVEDVCRRKLLTSRPLAAGCHAGAVETGEVAGCCPQCSAPRTPSPTGPIRRVLQPGHASTGRTPDPSAPTHLAAAHLLFSTSPEMGLARKKPMSTGVGA